MNATETRLLTDRVLAVLKREFPDLAVANKGGQYEAASATLKFEFTPGGAAAKEDKSRADFAKYAELYGLRPDHFGRSFKFRRAIYTVSGINPGAVKFAVHATRADGKSFKFPPETVLAGLAT